MDGPIYLKSGITLSGVFNSEFLSFTGVHVYNGPNAGSVAEEAMIIVDGVSNAEVGAILSSYAICLWRYALLRSYARLMGRTGPHHDSSLPHES